MRAQEAAFRSSIDLVYVTATVTGRDGRVMTGLRQEDFVVSDNGVPQEIVSFTSDRVPVSLGLLLDVSDSMTEARMSPARAAIERFAFDLLGPDDELFLAEFGRDVRLLQTWTRDRQLLRLALERAGRRSMGFGTALFDAVMDLVPFVATGAHTKKALILLSDGNDSASRVTVRQAEERIRQSGVLVYALGVEDRAGSGARIDGRALRRLTDGTGGRTETVRGFERLDEATARLADELNHQYLIGYRAPAQQDGRWREIKVDVRTRGAQVRARAGYTALSP